MTPVTSMAGRRVALFGLGGSGLATALALKAGGAEVLAGDDGPKGLAKAREAGIAAADLLAADWTGISTLVLSPGVPLTHKDGVPYTHPVVARARDAGAEVIGDIELFCRERASIVPGSPFVAITGTNGKSTTTALVAHILREAGRDVQMGGNIGTPILALEPPAMDRVHVIELSSFQIDLTPSFGSTRHPAPHAEVLANGQPRSTHDRGGSFEAPLRGAPQDEGGSSFFAFDRSPWDRRDSVPTIGVLLNITPDHLDRHGAISDYARIKARVLPNHGLLVLGVDDQLCRDILEIVEHTEGLPTVKISGQKLFCPEDIVAPSQVYNCGVSGKGSQVAVSRARFEMVGHIKKMVFEQATIADLWEMSALRGSHNAQNAAAATAVTIALGATFQKVAAALRTFPGLPHRMEEVGRRGRVLFVNDSKATNADSAEKALLSFDDNFWIAGGKPKEGGILPLKPLFTKIAKAYLIGEAAEDFAATLGDEVPHVLCGTLDRAVAEAAADAAQSEAQEPVVLLSPACASYDQFPNFEVRGDRFRDLVRALPGLEGRR